MGWLGAEQIPSAQVGNHALKKGNLHVSTQMQMEDRAGAWSFECIVNTSSKRTYKWVAWVARNTSLHARMPQKRVLQYPSYFFDLVYLFSETVLAILVVRTRTNWYGVLLF